MSDCPTFTPSSTDPAQIHNDLMETYMNGVRRPDVKYGVAEDTTLDSNSHVPVAVLQAKYQKLQDGGFLPHTLPSGKNSTTAVEDNLRKDRAFTAALRAEFCHYYSRFGYAYDRFIMAVTGNASQASMSQGNALLSDLKTLNARTIYVIEFADYVAQKRIPPAQADAQSIQTLNASLNVKLVRLRAANDKFKHEKAIVMTQREMVKYTATKNAQSMQTLSFWIGANVVALGAIGAAYAFM